MASLDPRTDTVVVGPRDHPLARGLSGPHRRFEPRQPALPQALTGGPEERRVVLIEDGAVLPIGWQATIERHLSAARPPDVLAAVNTHASGPERLEVGPLPRRATAADWHPLASSIERRWRGVREDAEALSSPMLVLRDPLAQREALERWWSEDNRRPLVLERDTVLSIAHDLAVLRGPGRGHHFLGAAVKDSELPDADPSPSALGRIADALPADQIVGRPGLQRRLAEALARLGDSPRSIAHAQACLRSWPRHVGTRLWLVQSWIRSGSLDRARRGIEALQQDVPLRGSRKAHLLACLGELWRLSGDGRQAEQCLDAALELDALQALALDSRGLVELEAGGFEGAIRFFRQAARSDPYFAAAWSDCGRALAMSGQVEAARNALARALALQPANREARRLLARISPSTPARPQAVQSK